MNHEEKQFRDLYARAWANRPRCYFCNIDGWKERFVCVTFATPKEEIVPEERHLPFVRNQWVCMPCGTLIKNIVALFQKE